MRAIYSIHDAPQDAVPLGMNMARASVPVPSIGPGDVLVKTTHIGLNRADTVQAAGHYPPPTGITAILGLELAGTVEAVGSDVADLRRGQQVCALVKGGAYADYAAVSRNMIFPLPETWNAAQGAAFVEAAATTCYALFDRLRLHSGDSVLIHGGSGAVGSLAVQIAAHCGLRVIASAGSAERCDAVAKLADCLAVVDYHDDVAAAVKEATAGRGVDGIVDVSGAAGMAANLRSLAYGGRLMVLGMQKGSRADVPLPLMLMKSLAIMSGTVRNLPMEHIDVLRGRMMQTIWPLADQGAIAPVIDSEFSLDDAAQAHMRQLGWSIGADGRKIPLEGQERAFGKVLLKA